MKAEKNLAPFFMKPTRADRIEAWLKTKPDPSAAIIEMHLRSYRRCLARFGVLPLDRLRALPAPHNFFQQCGVYFLWRGPMLVYVGKSNKVAARVCQHRNDGKRFTHATFLLSAEDLCRAYERLYIFRYRPYLNQIL